MPPTTTLPVAGSWATCPLKKRKPSISTAWENGPTGGASSGEVIAVLLIVAPVVTSAADRSSKRNECLQRLPCADRKGIESFSRREAANLPHRVIDLHVDRELPQLHR